MKVLVVGGGGREHAIAWKLSQSPLLDEMFVAPGNWGTEQVGQNLPIGAENIDDLFGFATKQRIDLTVVGPDAPLAAGIVDRFQAAGLAIFGPTKAAARIESSKSFAKSLMVGAGVPTGKAEVFDDYQRALDSLATHDIPVVVKADGLALGKGVTVATTREEAELAVKDAMLDRRFGESGDHVLIEEYLEGPEVSVFAFTDGKNVVSPLAAACDYKRVGDGDTGPNTGGMGAYSPPQNTLWNHDLEHEVRNRIVEPVLKALRDKGSPYSGVLYAGLMITKDGPKVIEFNCRLGDPETQVVLPRLKSDLLEVMMKTAAGELENVAIKWEPKAHVGVVVASGGYPDVYETGLPITGLDDLDSDVLVFHAGTQSKESAQGPVTSGGRVLTVVAPGDSIELARAKVYENVQTISFPNTYSRRDIALLA